MVGGKARRIAPPTWRVPPVPGPSRNARLRSHLTRSPSRRRMGAILRTAFPIRRPSVRTRPLIQVGRSHSLPDPGERMAPRPIPMQARPMRLEPGLRPVRLGRGAADEAPEFRRVVHVNHMRRLVRREIVEHEGRRENEAPGEAEPPRRGAGAPAAHRVAHRDALRLDPDRSRVARDRRLDVFRRFAPEEIGHAARAHAAARPRRRFLARPRPPPARRFRAPRPVDDAVIDPAQRRPRRRLEGDRARQPREPDADPAGMALGIASSLFSQDDVCSEDGS